MNVFTINKGFIFAATLIVTGVIGLVDSASANYNYKHDPRNNYKFDSYHNGHKSSAWHYKKGHVQQRHYKKRHKHHYSPRHRYYNKGYSKNYSYGYHHQHHRYYDHDYGYSDRNEYYGSKTNSHCYTYKVTSHGGNGGFRFQHDKKAFKRINNSSYVNKICGYDSVEFELSKVQPGVSISIEINGRYFNYPAHSGHDRYINNWHRKYFSVNFKHH